MPCQRNSMWISVQERLPENDTYVLVTIQVRNKEPKGRSSFYHNGCFHNDNGDLWRVGERALKAWMPTPEPYKEKRE